MLSLPCGTLKEPFLWRNRDAAFRPERTAKKARRPKRNAARRKRRARAQTPGPLRELRDRPGTPDHAETIATAKTETFKIILLHLPCLLNQNCCPPEPGAFTYYGGPGIGGAQMYCAADGFDRIALFPAGRVTMASLLARDLHGKHLSVIAGRSRSIQ